MMAFLLTMWRRAARLLVARITLRSIRATGASTVGAPQLADRPAHESPRYCPPDHEEGIAAGLKCLLLAMISRVHSPDLGEGRAVAMTAQSHKTAEEQYEEQVRILIRIVSASTLGLLAFAAGLLIGTFLFS
jgi:hypothetical protein